MVLKTDKIWFDGKMVDWDEANVHVLTHTLHYGLGVFEGIRAYDCKDGSSAVFRLPEHVQRLFDSAAIAGLDIPFGQEEIADAVLETLKINKLSNGYIRPLVFVGFGDSMGVNPASNPVQVAIATWAWGAYLGPEALEKGIRVKTSSYSRHHVNVMMTKAKMCGNYVNSVLAKMEALKDGYNEALMLDTHGYVSEGSGENIFMVRKGVVKTPPLSSVLEGITRESVIALARDLGHTVVEAPFTRDELYTADEAFFTGTAAEVTPIREIDNRVIGPGRAGEVTKTLQKEFFCIVGGENPKYGHWLRHYDA
jgi:branched-chain amino acid aminotransferase